MKLIDTKNISIYLGGIETIFEKTSFERPIILSPYYADFLDSKNQEVVVRIHLSEYQGKVPGIPYFTADNWIAFCLNDRETLIQLGRLTSEPDKYAYTALFHRDSPNVDLYINLQASDPPLSSIEMPPPMLDELIAQQLLAFGRGVLFHACGVRVDAQTGYLFAGVSGSGKTTTARLWQQHPEFTLLGDERVVVRKQDGQLKMVSTPWHSPEFSLGLEMAPLTKLFILKHDTRNHARRLGPAEAVSLLVPRTCLPMWDAAGIDFSLAFLEEVCRAVPCYELGFLPDQSAVEYVQCLT